MRAAAQPSAEDRLIARYFKPLAKHPGAYGLVDDCATLAVPAGHEVVLKTDAIIGGVHFFPDDPADLVARKALRVNLSDLAAKGARPAGFLLALALPKAVSAGWLKAFARGLGADADAFGCPLLGGDTDRTPGPVTVAITAFGTLPKGTMVLRMGARPGDRIFVTGTIGDAALGLQIRRDPGLAARLRLGARHKAHLSRRYLLPMPRNALAEAIRRHASAAMDVSDGLVGDLSKLCAASKVSAVIEAARVPLSAAARASIAAAPSLMATALTGGDDYEVVCTVPPRKVESMRTAAAKAGVPIAEVGEVTTGRGRPRFLDGDGKPLLFKRASFSHF